MIKKKKDGLSGFGVIMSRDEITITLKRRMSIVADFLSPRELRSE